MVLVGILAVEAYHSGAIRTLLIQNGDVVTPYGVNVTTIVNAISAARMTLDGSMTTDDVGKCFLLISTLHLLYASTACNCFSWYQCVSCV